MTGLVSGQAVLWSIFWDPFLQDFSPLRNLQGFKPHQKPLQKPLLSSSVPVLERKLKPATIWHVESSWAHQKTNKTYRKYIENISYDIRKQSKPCWSMPPLLGWRQVAAVSADLSRSLNERLLKSLNTWRTPWFHGIVISHGNILVLSWSICFRISAWPPAVSGKVWSISGQIAIPHRAPRIRNWKRCSLKQHISHLSSVPQSPL